MSHLRLNPLVTKTVAITNSIGHCPMIKRYNNVSLLCFIPGMIAQVAGLIMMDNAQAPAPNRLLALGLLIGGTVLSITGVAYYAKAKGKSAMWGLAGFLGLPGLLLLASFKDRSGDPWNT